MNKGNVVQVIGPVVDIEFSEGELPPILTALNITNPAIDDIEDNLVVEVAQHLGDNVVRCVAMDTTDGLVRGMEAKNTGNPISLLTLKTLWPVPENLIKKIAGNIGQVVVVEMNLGQYVREIERILPDRQVDFLGQMDGRLITPQQIEEVVTHV